MASKKPSVSSKNSQIQKASTQTFASVAIASIIVSTSVVIINILWSNANYNSKVHGVQEEARDTLQSNIDVTAELEESFRRLEIGADLLSDQDPDKKNSEIILDALPSKFDFPELATSMENLAESSSVNLESIGGTDLGSEAASSSPTPVPTSIPFTLGIDGDYASINKFLQGLENSIRPIRVVSINMSGTSDSLRVTISAETTYQPAFDNTIQTQVVTQ